jgi:hypothetical protein
MSKTNIFDTDTAQTAVQVIRETMSVSLEDGIPMVSFATNKGKGSGAQVMPVAEFREYVDTLEHFASIGVERVELGNLSPAETVRQTIRQDDGVISFRVRSGKGSKPAKVSADEFSEVTGLLRSTLEAVENAATKLA